MRERGRGIQGQRERERQKDSRSGRGREERTGIYKYINRHLNLKTLNPVHELKNKNTDPKPCV